MHIQNYTSKVLRSIAYLWIAMPLFFLVYARIVLAVHTRGLFSILLSPSYWAIATLAVVAGRGILLIRWYGWYAFIGSNVTLAYQTAITLVTYSERRHEFAIFSITTFIQIIFIYLVGREVRVPYFFPKIRWWESDPRYKLSVPVKAARGDQSELEGEIMDISLGGCFMKTHHYFVPDEELSLSFTLFEKPLQCKGRVVWRTESTVTHPRGIGVKFEELSKDASYCLKQATRKLRKLARTYSQLAREKNWQEYLQREQQFQGKKTPKDSS